MNRISVLSPTIHLLVTIWSSATVDGVLADLPPDKEIHVILDNYSTHKNNNDWLAKFEGRVHFHFTPTSASWLNQIEVVFSVIQRKVIKPADFADLETLTGRLSNFEPRYNAAARPFDWRFTRGVPAKIRLVNERHAFHGMQHPIHLHGQRFLVLSVNGVPTEDLGWKDTVLVPAGSGSVVLRYRSRFFAAGALISTTSLIVCLTLLIRMRSV